MFFKRRQPEAPLYPLTKYAQRITTLTEYAFGETVTFVQPEATPHLTEAEQRVLELEQSGFRLAQTLVVPDRHKNPGYGPGNIHVFHIDPQQEAARGILRIWAATRIATAIETYGTDNVVVCRSTHYPVPAESMYEPHEYMAMYVRDDTENHTEFPHSSSQS